jgi:predicted Zn-dependent protease
MTHSRRVFLKTLGVTGGAAAVVHLIDGPFSLLQRIEAAPIGADEFNALANLAFDQARQLGCAYAHILINGYRTGSVSLRNSPGYSAEVTSGDLNYSSTVIETASFRVKVRVLHSGAWGFAERPSVRKSEIARITAQAVVLAQSNAGLTERPIVLARAAVFNERCIPLHQGDHLNTLIKERLARQQAVDDGPITFRTEEMFFASTRGACSRTTRLRGFERNEFQHVSP